MNKYTKILSTALTLAALSSASAYADNCAVVDAHGKSLVAEGMTLELSAESCEAVQKAALSGDFSALSAEDMKAVEGKVEGVPAAPAAH